MNKGHAMETLERFSDEEIRAEYNKQVCIQDKDPDTREFITILDEIMVQRSRVKNEVDLILLDWEGKHRLKTNK